MNYEEWLEARAQEAEETEQPWMMDETVIARAWEKYNANS